VTGSYEGPTAADRGIDYEGLLARAAKGDQRAWDTLVDLLSGRVWAVARSYRLSRADAEDVFQVSFLRLMSHIQTIRQPASVGAWLATTARRECLRLVQQRERYRLVENSGDLDHIAEATSRPEDEILRGERDAVVLRGFLRLSPACQ